MVCRVDKVKAGWLFYSLAAGFGIGGLAIGFFQTDSTLIAKILAAGLP